MTKFPGLIEDILSNLISVFTSKQTEREKDSTQ